jgi:hypothetical protein
MANDGGEFSMRPLPVFDAKSSKSGSGFLLPILPKHPFIMGVLAPMNSGKSTELPTLRLSVLTQTPIFL